MKYLWELFWNLDYSGYFILSFCFDEESITSVAKDGEVKSMILEAVGNLVV